MCIQTLSNQLLLFLRFVPLDAECDASVAAAAMINLPAGQCIVTELGARIESHDVAPCSGTPTLLRGFELTVRIDPLTAALNVTIVGDLPLLESGEGSLAGVAKLERAMRCEFDDATLLPEAPLCPCSIEHRYTSIDVQFRASFFVGTDVECGPFDYVPGSAELALQLNLQDATPIEQQVVSLPVSFFFDLNVFF